MNDNVIKDEENKAPTDLSSIYNSLPDSVFKQFLSELMLNIMNWYIAKVKQEEEAKLTDDGENV